MKSNSSLRTNILYCLTTASITRCICGGFVCVRICFNYLGREGQKRFSNKTTPDLKLSTKSSSTNTLRNIPPQKKKKNGPPNNVSALHSHYLHCNNAFSHQINLFIIKFVHYNNVLVSLNFFVLKVCIVQMFNKFNFFIKKYVRMPENSQGEFEHKYIREDFS